MTVIRSVSQPVTSGEQLSFAAPGGEWTWRCVRVSNYTPYVVRLSNTSDAFNTPVQTLLPYQQNVYQYSSQQGPVLATVSYTTNKAGSFLLVEFSDDIRTGFPGRYPTPLAIQVGSGDGTGGGTVDQILAGTHVTVTPATGRGVVTVNAETQTTDKVALGGDVTGTSTANVVSKVPTGAIVVGTRLTASTTDGKLKLVADVQTAGTVDQILAGTHVTVTPATGRGVVTVNAETQTTDKVALGGDVTGTSTANVVSKVPTGAIVVGTRLTASTTDGKLKLVADVQTVDKVALGGDVTGTSTANVVSKVPTGAIVVGTRLTASTTDGKLKLVADVQTVALSSVSSYLSTIVDLTATTTHGIIYIILPAGTWKLTAWATSNSTASEQSKVTIVIAKTSASFTNALAGAVIPVYGGAQGAAYAYSTGFMTCIVTPIETTAYYLNANASAACHILPSSGTIVSKVLTGLLAVRIG